MRFIFIMTVACGGCTNHELPDAPSKTIDAPTPAAKVAADFATTTTCGQPPTTAPLTIENTGLGELIVSSADADHGFTVMTPLPLSIPAGTSSNLAVLPPPPMFGGTIDIGTLTINTNDAVGAHVVALHSSVNGANLAFTDALGTPIVLTFSSTSSTCPLPASVYLRNVGNVALVVDGLPVGTHFAFSPATGVLNPGEAKSESIRVSTFGDCTASELLTYSVNSTALCTPSPVLAATFTITGSASCFCD